MHCHILTILIFNITLYYLLSFLLFRNESSWIGNKEQRIRKWSLRWKRGTNRAYVYTCIEQNGLWREEGREGERGFTLYFGFLLFSIFINLTSFDPFAICVFFSFLFLVLLLTYIHSYSYSASYFHTCTALHYRRRRGGGRSIAGSGRERRAWTKPPYPCTQTGWARYTVLLRFILFYAVLFYFLTPISSHSFFYLRMFKLSGRYFECWIRMYSIHITHTHTHTPLPTHTHPLPPPPPLYTLCRCLWDGKWKQLRRNSARRTR